MLKGMGPLYLANLRNVRKSSLSIQNGMGTDLHLLDGVCTFEGALIVVPPVGDSVRTHCIHTRWWFGPSRHGLKFTTRTLGADIEQRIQHRVACAWTIPKFIPHIRYPGTFLEERFSMSQHQLRINGGKPSSQLCRHARSHVFKRT